MSADADAPKTDLRSLRLRPGMFLQTLPLGSGSPPCEAQFCAAIGGKGLMVVPMPGPNGAPALRPGESRRVRGFTGQFDFEFVTEVVQCFEQPFAYTLLAYPAEVTAKLVRRSQRVATAIPAYARPAGQAAPLPGALVDLSASGAMFGSADPVGAIGDTARLSFSIVLDGREHDLNLEATICHAGRNDKGEGFRTGFAFKGLGRTDTLALQCYALANLDAAGEA